MYIRRVTTRRSASGEAYYSYRLVETRREGARVRQIALLNLGRHFDLAEEHWGALCARIEQILSPQDVLMPVELPEAVETQAQAIAARLLARTLLDAPASTAEFAEVDVSHPTLRVGFVRHCRIPRYARDPRYALSCALRAGLATSQSGPLWALVMASSRSPRPSRASPARDPWSTPWSWCNRAR